MNYITAYHQGNMQAGFFNCYTLQLINNANIYLVDDRTDFANANVLCERFGYFIQASVYLAHLPNFFFERHFPDKHSDTLLYRGRFIYCGGTGGCHITYPSFVKVFYKASFFRLLITIAVQLHFH